MICSPQIYLLVDCQRPDFDLTTDNEEVIGRLRGSVTLRWYIMKKNETDLLNTANLILPDPARFLFTYEVSTKATFPGSRRNIFGDRINCDITDGKTYICTLQNLTYNDTNIFFELEVGIRRGDDTSLLKRKRIHLTVEGMEIMIITFLVSKKVRRYYLLVS